MNLTELESLVAIVARDITLSVRDRLKGICQLLHDNVNAYDWVGFYFADHHAKTLHLSAYVGEHTDHTVIPFGKGICGQVALSNANFVVADVAAQNNYIACSIHVKSEIVIPIFIDGVNIGQIDIDSKTINAFTAADEEFLAFVNEEVAKLVKGIEMHKLLEK